MSAEARRSWHPAIARWGGEKSEADAAKAAATRRPTRVGFARIAESVVPDARVATPAPLFELALKKTKSASKKMKTEFYKVVRVRGDGRCMFRSLAIGLAHLTGRNLSSAEEETEADQLRLAVAESLCRSPEKRKKFELATTAISFEMPIETYCKRVLMPSFWGGEPELLVLAEILRRPIVVYIPAAKVKSAERNAGFVPIQTYGADFKVTKKGNPKKPVRLLYNGENHYDVLI